MRKISRKAMKNSALVSDVGEVWKHWIFLPFCKETRWFLTMKIRPQFITKHCDAVHSWFTLACLNLRTITQISDFYNCNIEIYFSAFSSFLRHHGQKLKQVSVLLIKVFLNPRQNLLSNLIQYSPLVFRMDDLIPIFFSSTFQSLKK